MGVLWAERMERHLRPKVLLNFVYASPMDRIGKLWVPFHGPSWFIRWLHPIKRIGIGHSNEISSYWFGRLSRSATLRIITPRIPTSHLRSTSSDSLAQSVCVSRFLPWCSLHCTGLPNWSPVSCVIFKDDEWPYLEFPRAYILKSAVRNQLHVRLFNCVTATDCWRDVPLRTVISNNVPNFFNPKLEEPISHLWFGDKPMDASIPL